MRGPNLRQEQAAETRRKLLDAARTLFARQGYAGTPVRSINRAINMADGLLYHYFPGGKKEMFRVLLRESFAEVKSGVRDYNAHVEGLPLEQVLDNVYLFWDGVFSRYMELLKIVFRENGTHELIEMDALRRLLEQRRQWMVRLLEDRWRSGEIRKMDFEMAAEHILSLGISNLMSKMVGIEDDLFDDAERRRRSIRHIVSLWKNS